MGRKPKIYEVDGVEYTMNQLSEKFGIKRDTITHRLLSLGWSIEQAVKTPVDERLSKNSSRKKCNTSSCATANSSNNKAIKAAEKKRKENWSLTSVYGGYNTVTK